MGQPRLCCDDVVLIQRDQLIAGRPAAEVRELMRTLRWTAHSEAGLAAALDMSVPEASGLVADLRAEGLIDVVSDYSGPYVVGRDEDLGHDSRPVLLRTTVRGNALAKARLGKPMSRADAQKLCDGVVARAREANAADEWLHWVVELGLYGSFAVPGDGPVGDVDLVVCLEHRYEHEDYLRRNDAMIEADGARPQSIVAALSYAEVKLLRYLRGRSPRVDLLQGGPRGSGLPPDVSPVPLYRFSPPD